MINYITIREFKLIVQVLLNKELPIIKSVFIYKIYKEFDANKN